MLQRGDQKGWGDGGSGGAPDLSFVVGAGGGCGGTGSGSVGGGDGGVGGGLIRGNDCRSGGGGRRLQDSECPTCSSDDLKLVYDTVGEKEPELLGVESKLQICIDEAKGEKGIKSLFACLLRQALEILSVAPLAREVVDCSLENQECYGDLSNRPGQLNLLIQADRFQSFLQLALLAFGGSLLGDPESILLNNTAVPTFDELETFGTAVVNGLSDTSAGGRSLTLAETDDLLAAQFGALSDDDIFLFADTWNRSLTLWDTGVVSSLDLPADYNYGFFDLSAASALIEKFENDRVAVRNEGFTGFGDAWRKAVEGQQFEEARQLAGICANVRIRIRQELTLTRIGFEAKLEVSNAGTFPLKNIAVTLRVNPFGNFTGDATNLFVIGEPDLYQISAVDGSGMLGAESTGEVTWLMLPLTEAAPQFDTRYDVSGLLVYTIDGVEYQQNLAPDTITVKPDPQLYLTYFHSRIAYADDPFTEDVREPSIPYHLGLLIENRGFGEARDVRIESSQPEIIENEKGLLVDFSIIGARFGDLPTANTLNIDFGTIAPQSNVIGVWDMVSTLRGRFYNFSATFEYRGPIDDDRLSLIENVTIYELAHLVRITGDHPAMPNSLGYEEDGFDDFLANTDSNRDVAGLPDTVFTSETRASSYRISTWVDQVTSVSEPEYSGDSLLVRVTHNLTGAELSALEDWVYIRFDDPMANTDYILQDVTRPDVGYTLIAQANSWQTAWTDYLVGGVEEELDHIHLFDFGVAQTYVLRYALQQPVQNLRVTDASENSLTVAWDPAAGASSSYILIKPTGYSDEYYKVAKEFTQVESHEIRNLMSGMSYTIKLLTGKEGKYESVGATVVGLTSGNSTCGDNDIDIGEDCDDGADNGNIDLTNCTSACVYFVARTSRPGTDSPVAAPSTAPSTTPSMAPSESPSLSPDSTPVTVPPGTPTAAPDTTTPSLAPSVSPSLSPDSTPVTVSPGTPTAAPDTSVLPGMPTAAPEISVLPGTPTAAPVDSVPATAAPTRLPTAAPTAAPTVSPTLAPVTFFDVVLGVLLFPINLIVQLGNFILSVPSLIFGSGEE